MNNHIRARDHNQVSNTSPKNQGVAPWRKMQNNQHQELISTVGYTILNQHYLGLVGSITEQLDKEKIPYCFHGGCAVQIWVASILTENGKKDIISLRGHEDKFRPTDDVDTFADYRNSPIDPIGFLNKFTMLHSREFKNICVQSANNLRYEGLGISVNFETDPADAKFGFDKVYYDIIASSENRCLRRGNETYYLNVSRPEYIVVGKCLRNKPKDVWDIYTLLTTIKDSKIKFDVGLVNNTLKILNKEECYAIFQEILLDVNKQNIKG